MSVDVSWVRSHFGSVLRARSNTGFPTVKPAYSDQRSHLLKWQKPGEKLLGFFRQLNLQMGDRTCWMTAVFE